MKTIKQCSTLIIIISFLISFQVQAQSRAVKKILDNPEDRTYLMLKISNDKQLTTEMINYLSNNVEAVALLKAKFAEPKEMMMKKKMTEKKAEVKQKMEMCAMCKKKLKDKIQDEIDEN